MLCSFWIVVGFLFFILLPLFDFGNCSDSCSVCTVNAYNKHTNTHCHGIQKLNATNLGLNEFIHLSSLALPHRFDSLTIFTVSSRSLNFSADLIIVIIIIYFNSHTSNTHKNTPHVIHTPFIALFRSIAIFVAYSILIYSKSVFCNNCPYC